MSLVTNTEILNYLQASQGVTVPAEGQTLLTMIQPMVEGEVKRILGSRVESETYTEYYPESPSNSLAGDDMLVAGFDFNGTRATQRTVGDRSLATMQLRNLPVRSVTSVYESFDAWDGDDTDGDWSSDDLLSPTQYRVDFFTAGISLTGYLVRKVGIWSTIPRSTKVVYVAGWSSGEITTYFPQVKMATLIAIAYHYAVAVARSKMGMAGGQVSGVSIEGFSLSVNQDQVGGYAGRNYSLPPEAVALLAPYINLSRYLF